MLKKTTTAELEAVMHLYQQAIAYFKTNKIDQWQVHGPDRQSLHADMAANQSFVYVEDGQVRGSVALILGGEPDYTVIEGAWLAAGPYLTMHRVVVDENHKGKGIAQAMMQHAVDYGKAHGCHSIRIDTHQDNQAMRRFLEKAGFKYCGIVYVHGTLKRLAYQKVFYETNTKTT